MLNVNDKVEFIKGYFEGSRGIVTNKNVEDAYLIIDVDHPHGGEVEVFFSEIDERVLKKVEHN